MIRILVLVFVFSLLSITFLFAAEPEEVTSQIKEHTLIYPKDYKNHTFDWSVGAMLTNMPKDWVETAIRAPIFSFNFKYGLPHNFALSADAEIIIVANQLRLGPRWGLDFGQFSFNLGYDLGYVFGQLKQFGFNNSVNAWYHYPNASLGFNIDDLYFTLIGELMVTTYSSIKTDGIETSNSKNRVLGGTVSLYLEQSLWKDHIFIIGLKNNITKFYYPAWPVFTTFDRLYWIPQLHLGVVL